MVYITHQLCSADNRTLAAKKDKKKDKKSDFAARPIAGALLVPYLQAMHIRRELRVVGIGFEPHFGQIGPIVASAGMVC